MASAKYFEMVRHEVDHILPPETALVQLINRIQCCYRIHGIIGRIQFEHLDIAQYRLIGPDNNLIFQVNHSRIGEACKSKIKSKN